MHPELWSEPIVKLSRYRIVELIIEGKAPHFCLDIWSSDAVISSLLQCKTVRLGATSILPTSKMRIDHDVDPLSLLLARRAYRVVPDGLVDLALIDVTDSADNLGEILACIEKVSNNRTTCVIQCANSEEARQEEVRLTLISAKLAQQHIVLKWQPCSDGWIAVVSGFKTNRWADLRKMFMEYGNALTECLDEALVEQHAPFGTYNSADEIRSEMTEKRTTAPTATWNGIPNEIVAKGSLPKTIQPNVRFHTSQTVKRDGSLPREAGIWMGKPMQPPRLYVENYKNIFICPSDGLNRLSLFDQGNRLIEASLVPRYGFGKSENDPAVKYMGGSKLLVDGCYYDHVDVEKIRNDAVKRVIDEAIIIGHFDKEFGHFLTESLCRAWALTLARFKDMPVVVWGESAGLKPHHEKAVELLGIQKDRLIIATEPAIIKDAWVPARAYRLFGAASTAMKTVWSRIRDQSCKEYEDEGERRLFLSRAANPRRVLKNQDIVEKLFLDRGFKVIQPETLPFSKQVALVGRANMLAGCFGSQMHLSMFLPEDAFKFVIASESFAFPDEAIITAANGTRANFFIQPASTEMETDAMSADWEVNIHDLEKALDTWMAEIDVGNLATQETH